jgi:hypothetical protein
MEKGRPFLVDLVPGFEQFEMAFPGRLIGPSWRDCLIRASQARLFVFRHPDGTNITVDDDVIIDGRRLTYDAALVWFIRPGRAMGVTFAQDDAISLLVPQSFLRPSPAPGVVRSTSAARALRVTAGCHP